MLARVLVTALFVPVFVLGAPASGARFRPHQRVSEQTPAPQRLRLVDRDHLPLAFAEPLLAKAELTFHDLESLANAFYEPSRMVVVANLEAGGDGGDIQLRPPRISLQRRFFSTPEVVFPDLTIDLAENLAFALLLGHLHDLVERDTEYGAFLRQRALASRSEGQSIEDVVAAQMMAIASYGSHLLSLVNEVERLERRRRARGGSDLCQLIQERVGLLGFWERAFTGPFAGSAFDSSGNEVVRWLEDADKQRLVEEVFGGVWSGDAVADFGDRYCGR